MATERRLRFQLEGVEGTGVKIGCGSYAVVEEYDFLGLSCAGKSIHQNIFENATASERDDMLERFEAECEMLNRLHHPHIVQFLGVYFRESSPLPVMLMERLHSTLTACIECYGKLPYPLGYSILYDVAIGLRYLHGHIPSPIIHRDLTANNVLLTLDMSAKISDLGVAKILNLTPTRMVQMTACPGTPSYMPPEALVARPIYSTEIDMFAYGNLMTHVFCGRWPVPTEVFRTDMSDPNSVTPLTEVQRREEYLNDIGNTHPLMELMRKCLSNTPKARPNISEVLCRIKKMTTEFPPSLVDKVEFLQRIQVAASTDNRKEQLQLQLHQGGRERKSSNDADRLEAKRLRSMVTAMEKRLSIKQKEAEADQAIIKANEQEIKTVQAIIRAKDQEIALKDQESATKQQQIDNMKSLLTVEGEEVSSLQEEVSSKDTTLKAKDSTIASLVSQVKQVEGLLQRIQSFSDDNAALNKKIIATCMEQSQSQTASDKLEISRQQVKLVKKLEVRQFGEIWEGLWNATTPVTVKTLKSGTITPTEFFQEAELMKRLRHPNLLSLYAMCTKEEPLFTVCEFMKHGYLRDYLKEECRSMELHQLIDMPAQVAAGMTYLEELNCIHCDLAARNIMVADSNICKVADFSRARVIDGDFYEVPATTKLPIKWTAPEVMTNKKYTNKSDVWSFGVVLYEVVTYGSIPYRGMLNADVVAKVQNGYRMDCPAGCPSQLHSLMLDCWKEDPLLRPTFGFIHRQLNEFVMP